MRKDRRTISGFTLVELITSMAIGMIVLSALYSVFIMQNRTLSTQEQIAEIQQTARIGMDIMLRDIRMAGYNPSKTTSWISGTKPGLTNATADSLSFVSDLNADADTTAAEVNPEENVTYDRVDDGGISCLRRTVNGAGNSLVENMESLTFVYYDEAGNTLSLPASLSDVRKIQVTITAKTALPDNAYVDPILGDHYRRYSLTSQVTPRNLGL
ncbi:MAG TPA: hypothetical protein DCZ97_06655 [Syntrophus sp. (in: bacteria)]|nr:MAG: hypothetical protein A2X92_08100 [Syntrophus sp. GWC2_56_31]HBB16688.1 hypothetical protein [Syntrophus sp. (in: bacteria)]